MESDRREERLSGGAAELPGFALWAESTAVSSPEVTTVSSGPRGGSGLPQVPQYRLPEGAGCLHEGHCGMGQACQIPQGQARGRRLRSAKHPHGLVAPEEPHDWEYLHDALPLRTRVVNCACACHGCVVHTPALMQFS